MKKKQAYDHEPSLETENVGEETPHPSPALTGWSGLRDQLMNSSNSEIIASMNSSNSEIIASLVNYSPGSKETTIYLDQGEKHGVLADMFVAVDFEIDGRKGTRVGDIAGVYPTRSKGQIRTVHSSKVRWKQVRIGETQEQEVNPPSKGSTLQEENPSKEVSETSVEDTGLEIEEETGEEIEEDVLSKRDTEINALKQKWETLANRFDDEAKIPGEDHAELIVNTKLIKELVPKLVAIANKIKPRKEYSAEYDFADVLYKKLSAQRKRIRHDKEVAGEATMLLEASNKIGGRISALNGH